MGVIEKYGEAQPICNDCGVALCWSVSSEQYEEDKDFWDSWKCEDCNPKSSGSYIKFKVNKLISRF